MQGLWQETRAQPIDHRTGPWRTTHCSRVRLRVATPRRCGRSITEGGGTHPSNEVCPAWSLDQRGYGNIEIPRGPRSLTCPRSRHRMLEPYQTGDGRLASYD